MHFFKTSLLPAALITLAVVAGAPAASAAPAPGGNSETPCAKRGVGTGNGQGQANGRGAGLDKCPRTASLLYFQDAHEISPVEQEDGERGGVARLKSVLDTQRAEHPDSAVVFGGDLAGGTLFGGLYHGFPMVEAFNQMGVDVASFGQHDFDFGAQNALDLVTASDFPWVNSNLVTADGEPFLPGAPTHVQEVGDLRIGFIGLTGNMDTTTTAKEILEVDPVIAAEAAVDQLEGQDVDAIVAVTQIDKDVNERLLNEVPEIDASFREENSYVAASDVTVRDDGRLVLSPEGNMGSVLRLDITVEDGETALSHEELQVDDSVVPDAGLSAFEAHYIADMDAKLNEQIGTSTGYLDRVTVGNLAADAFRAYGGADLGWMNGGGARADIPGPTVTLRDAYSVLPFGNRVSVIEVTGEQLLAGLEHAGGDRTRPSGFSYTYSPGSPEGSRISDLHTPEGPIDPAATYTLAITSFVAQSNPAFQDARVVLSAEDGTVDVSALIDHIKALGTLFPDAQPRVAVQ